jgi:dienelactone hydrolase
MEASFKNEVVITLHNSIEQSGELVIPQQATGIAIFSHGSGSSRFSPRNKMVARRLQQNRIGTLLFDLLTPEEDRDYATRFNIELLTERLIATTQWLEQFSPAQHYRIGYFGASTGAASALKAAAALPQIKAVISRGGRPDLAMDVLERVQAPVLLIVGSRDDKVLHLNDLAYQGLSCIKTLKVVEGASHLFSEEGKLDIVADLAVEWCRRYISEITVS